MMSRESLDFASKQYGSTLISYLPGSDLMVPVNVPARIENPSACIYCRAATYGTEPIDHPVAQALGMRRYPLPRGYVCARCNDYVKDLDHHVCNHHHLATMIVVGRLVGSKGRVRRTVHQDFSIDIPTQRITIIASKRVTGEFQGGHLALAVRGERP